MLKVGKTYLTADGYTILIISCSDHNLSRNDLDKTVLRAKIVSGSESLWIGKHVAYYPNGRPINNKFSREVIF